MKISIYNLLGMIKDGKAPKEIIYENIEYTYKYIGYYSKQRGYLFDVYYVERILDEEVEILETTLNTKDMNISTFEIKDNRIVGTWKNGIPYHYTLSAPQMVLAEKMLEIIDKLNKEVKENEN